MADTARSTDLDAVVIGAGFAGLYMVYRLREKLGMSVQAYETAGDVGGTWNWNRYPGARCDSESYMYCFSFDKDLVQEWEWSGKYPEQPEILRYLNHVADRFDLCRDIQFNTAVTSARFREQDNRWSRRADALSARRLMGTPAPTFPVSHACSCRIPAAWERIGRSASTCGPTATRGSSSGLTTARPLLFVSERHWQRM